MTHTLSLNSATGQTEPLSHPTPTVQVGSKVRLDCTLIDADWDPLDDFVGHIGTVLEADSHGTLLVAFTPFDPMDDPNFWVSVHQITLVD